MTDVPSFNASGDPRGTQTAQNVVYGWIDSKGAPASGFVRLGEFIVSELDDWLRAGGAREPDQGAS